MDAPCACSCYQCITWRAQVISPLAYGLGFSERHYQ
jgi:hypothetical protein